VLAAGLVVVVVAAVVLLSVLDKGKSTPAPTTAASSAPSSSAPIAHPGASAPASLNVAVVNGTTVNQLAHRLASTLRRHRYARAQPLTVHPPAQAATTTVYYAGGHRTDARRVAQALGVSATAPLPASLRALSGPAPVVVVAGSDQAPAGQGAAPSGAAGGAASGATTGP
jgi:LytR cell envelope-related transcriptional attenuator